MGIDTLAVSNYTIQYNTHWYKNIKHTLWVVIGLGL